jgi:hypothetical protein
LKFCSVKSLDLPSQLILLPQLTTPRLPLATQSLAPMTPWRRLHFPWEDWLV